MSFVAKGGTVVTDEMLNKWADDAEHGIYLGEPGSTFIGHPPTEEEITDVVQPDVHISPDLWRLIINKARQLGVSTDEIVRQALIHELTVL